MARNPVPLGGMFGDGKLIARFMKYVLKTDTCWQWTGSSTDNHGFPRAQFRLKFMNAYASRVAYALFVDDVRPGELVLHTCDNGMCVNPEHLYIGTHEQNTADMIRRGRSRLGNPGKPRRRGYKRPFMNRVCKLTDDAVRAIRLDERPLHMVAAAWGVSEATVSNVKNRRRKAHIPDDGPVGVPPVRLR